jgi:hypothetical protein
MGDGMGDGDGRWMGDGMGDGTGERAARCEFERVYLPVLLILGGDPNCASHAHAAWHARGSVWTAHAW